MIFKLDRLGHYLLPLTHLDNSSKQVSLFGLHSRRSDTWTSWSCCDVITHIISPQHSHQGHQVTSVTCSLSHSAPILALIMAWLEHSEVNKAVVFFLDGKSNKRKSRHSQASPDSWKPQQENQALVCVSNLSAYIQYKLHACLYVTSVFFFLKAQKEIYFQGFIRDTQVHKSMNMNLTKEFGRVSSCTRLFLEKKKYKIRCKHIHDEARKLQFGDRAAGAFTANTHQGKLLQEEPCSGPTSFLLTNILHHCLSHQVNERHNSYRMLSGTGSGCDFGCV